MLNKIVCSLNVEKMLLAFFLILLVSLPASAQSLLDDLQIHGLVSQGYVKSTGNNFINSSSKDGSLEFGEIAVNFAVPVSDNLRLGMQLLSRDQGIEGNGFTSLDWGYGDYRWRDELGVRIGKIKMPKGFYNEGRDVDMLRTSALLPQSVYPEGRRDFALAYSGGSVYGTTGLKAAGELDYDFFLGSLNVPDVNSGFWREVFAGFASSVQQAMPAGSITRLTDQSVVNKYMAGGGVRWNTPIDGLRIGATTLFGELDFSTNVQATVPIADLGAMLDPSGEKIPAGMLNLQNTMVIPVEVNVKVDRLPILSAEYLFGDLTLAGEWTSMKTTSTLSDGSKSSSETAGYYGQVAYRVNDRLEVGSYYSVHYPDKSDKEGDRYEEDKYQAWQKDVVLSVRIDPVSHWTLKGEAHRINGVGQLSALDNPDGQEENWSMFFLKAAYSF